MKKTLAWLLTLFMVLTISSVTVFAAGTDVAKIGDVGYSSFEAALGAVQDGETITILDVEGSENKEIEFTKAISFTITGTAPNYALPTVTFQNATVTIKDAEILIPELDARQNATINVVDSIVHDAGGDSIVKSYYNGAINISGTSKVYTMQVTTMGYITVSDAAELHATWQTNVYGNGMITVENTAKFNTAALHLTGQDYSGRDNTDADRVGKSANIIVDGATFTVGKVFSNNGADYSYNSSKGINIGTVDGKSAVLDIKNGAKVEIHMANGETANIGADGIVNVAGSTFCVACRSTDGTATLVNNGTVNVSGESTLNVATLTGNTIDFLDGAIIKDSTIGGEVFVAGKVTFRGDNTFGMLSDFGTLTDYYGTTANMEWSVDAGASVTLTNKARYGLGYGDKVTIFGSLADALTARGTLGDDDIAVFMHGLVAQESAGWNQSSSVTVKDAYVVLGSNNSFGNKPGNYGGTYTFTFDNVVLDSSRITFYAADSKTNFTFNKSDVKVGTFMIRDTDTVFTLTDTKLVSTAATNGTDEGNYLAGTLVLNNSSLSYAYHLVMENGTLTLDATSSLTAPSITGTGKIVIDTTGMTVQDRPIVGNLSGFTGTIEVVGNTDVLASIDAVGNLVLKLPVASIGDTPYYSLQAAIDAAVDGDTITLVADVTENVVITQKADLDLTIDGANKIFTGVMTVFGNGRQSGAETLTIKNVVFQAVAGKDSCILSPDRSVYNKYSYSHNVTVENCTFYGNTETPRTAAAVRHNDGGDKNWTIKGCTVDANMHSLLQTNNVAGKLIIDDCTVNSKNGINLNSCTNVEITNCEISVKGYAVRAGVNTGGNLNETKNFVLENNTLTTDNTEGDAVIVLRADAAKATVSMEKNSVVGNTHISGVTETNNVEADGNYWGGASEPVVDGIAVKPNSYYTDSSFTDLAYNSLAKIGDVYYDTLEAAIAAAVDGDTIELLKGVEITKTLDVSYNSDFDKIDVVINGNGHTVKAVASDYWTANPKAWLADIAWNVTLNDIVFDGNNLGMRGLQFYTSESVLNNVTVKNISNDSWGITDYAIHSNASELTVTGALTFENCKHGHLAVSVGSNLPADTVSNVTVADSAVVSGVTVVLGGDNTTVVTKNPAMVSGAVTSINNVYYATLEDAFAVAANNSTVTLIADVNAAVTYAVDKTLTLDLSGYTIESDAAATLTATAGKLTIVDSSADQTGAIIGAKAIHSSAYVAIQSGKFVGAITTANNQADDSQVCITGGNFSVEPNANIIKHTYIAVLAEDETYNVIPDKYEVIINANGGVVTGAGFYKFGETVYIYADKNGNYIFAGWLSDDVEIMNPGERLASFVMPDHEVVVTAYWASNGTTTPVIPVMRGTIHFETNGGSAINSYTGTYGAKVDLAQFVTIRQGYTFAGWYSDAALSKPVTQLTLGGTKTVYAGWIETPVIPDVPVVVLPFTDVAADAYYYNAVLWAVGMGITNGISDTAFGPDMVCTRAQVVTFLWRAAGCPVAQNDDMPFADVTRDMYYYDAVLWAVEQGITNGISDTEFGPDAECSRAQIVTFLWRSQGSPAVEANGEFHDVDADAYYATAVEWAVDNGVTNGVGDDAFAPDAECTRAQTVTFLYRHFCK